MLGIYVSVPIACFRKGLAREYLETESLPPPSTCYGFLLSLVGETERARHIGCRVAPTLIGQPEISVVLRTVWRVKKTPLGAPGNTRPDYQQLLSETRLVVWLDSSEESSSPTLEERVRTSLMQPETVRRFGGLSMGESTHLVNDVNLFDNNSQVASDSDAHVYLLKEDGNFTLPVWVDHVGSAGTNFVTGQLLATDLSPPQSAEMPKIEPRQLV